MPKKSTPKPKAAFQDIEKVDAYLAKVTPETTDALEFLARLTSHIPDKNQVLQRYYGPYSSRVRAMRRKAAEENEDYEEHPLVIV